MRDEKKEKTDESSNTWKPYVAGAAACILTGPYVGAGVFFASKLYEKNQSAEPKQSQDSKPNP